MLGVGAGGPTGAFAGPAVVSLDGAGPDAAERDAWAVLAAVDGLGPVAFAALLARFGRATAVLETAAGPDAIARLAATPPVEGRDVLIERRPVTETLATTIATAVQAGPSILARMRAMGVRPITALDPRYPARLGAIAMPPLVLFVQGDPDALDRPRAVAVVGTRRPTTHGRAIAGRIGMALVAADTVVVSGLAYGIDGAAHDATIAAGGTTLAVLGGGAAVAVPTGHDRLAEAIVRSGGAVVSEHPPDLVPTRGTYPRRNRIISGLADATVVVEAPARSGALVTASWALEQGRPCFLVPGPIDRPTSAGCLAFLREFAGEARIVAGIPQLIADLALTANAEDARSDAPGDDLSRAAVQGLGTTTGRIATALRAGHATVDELVAALELPVAAVLAGLVLLERQGLAIGIAGRYRPSGALLGESIRRPRRRAGVVAPRGDPLLP